MTLSLIAARDSRGLIGCKNTIPWDIPEDRAYFRETTWGKTVVMGRRTAESLGGPLPGRANAVLSRGGAFRGEGLRIFSNLEEFLAAFENHAEEIFVIGGAQIYGLFMPLAAKMYLTDIESSFEGDAWFPAFPPGDWREGPSRGGKSAASGTGFTFRVFIRAAAYRNASASSPSAPLFTCPPRL
ncbi:MAG: dihydrofolate reductase [Spirochaetales bacterium]|jgi:dihydrofolate reductase|nr:dihydrofolate reductase [Spirochaetales bacterium]